MDSLDKARNTQLNNIQQKTGKKIDELRAEILSSGLQKHGEIRKLLMERYGLGFGDATMLVHFALQTDGQTAAEAAHTPMEEILSEIYYGSKAALRPLHDIVMARIDQLGEYSIAPKKGYLSLRRKRQFVMIGPGSKGRLEIGLNMKNVQGNDRLIEQPPGGMCQYKIFLTGESEIDDEFLRYLKTAYEASA